MIIGEGTTTGERRSPRAGVVLGLLMAAMALAHESPEHEIEALSLKIEKSGATAELLARRATEWRALGKYENAAKDLERALAINSNSVSVVLEYADVELGRGNARKAQALVRDGLARAADAEKPALHMMLAEVAERTGSYETALRECEIAMKDGEPRLEWHLTCARLMCLSAKHSEAVAALKAAYEKTPNVVLEVEWIEAMIDAGEHEKALARIAKYAGRGRWRSAWLIRQARAELGLNRREAAHANLKMALTELDRRINADKPDATLLADRAMGRLLLGDRVAAAADMDRIRGPLRTQATGSTVARLETMFRQGARAD